MPTPQYHTFRGQHNRPGRGMFQELNACPMATWYEQRREDRGDFHGHLQIHTRVTASARDEVRKIKYDLQVSRGARRTYTFRRRGRDSDQQSRPSRNRDWGGDISIAE